MGKQNQSDTKGQKSKKTDRPEEYSPNNVDERIVLLQAELYDCREEERQAESLLIQVISVAVTLLGILLSGSFLLNNQIVNQGIIKQVQTMNEAIFFSGERIVFILDSIVFCILLFYIVRIGNVKLLRYYHVKEIQKQLIELVEQKGEKGSMDELLLMEEIKAPIVTMNVKHLFSIHAVSHFMAYMGSIIASIIFCLGITLFQFMLIHPKAWYDYLALVLTLVIMTVCTGLLAYSMCNGKKIPAFARGKAKERRANQGEYVEDNSKVIHNILYFIYPRLSDLQKPLLIIGGAIVYFFISQSTFQWKMLSNLLISLVVFDYCGYQIRYQINDIRGFEEDDQSINNKGKRLICDEHNRGQYVVVSMAVILGRVGLAIVGILGTQDRVFQWGLLGELLLLFLITLFYEIARSKKCDCGVFFLVGVGYPLRILVGGVSVYVVDSGKMPSGYAIICFLLAVYGWGMFASLLTWATDIIAMRKNATDIKKSHFKMIDKWMYEGRKENLEYPLKEKGKMGEWWNLVFLLSVGLLIASKWWLAGNIIQISVEVVLLIGLVGICFMAEGYDIHLYLLTYLAVEIIIIYIFGDGDGGIISAIQVFVVGTYWFLRVQPKEISLAKIVRSVSYKVMVFIFTEKSVQEGLIFINRNFSSDSPDSPRYILSGSGGICPSGEEDEGIRGGRKEN